MTQPPDVDEKPWERAVPPSGKAKPRPAPEPMASVISQQPWFKSGTPDQRRMLLEAVRAERQRCLARKARVKAHPDLAERLRKALDAKRFEQWNGHVPAARDADGALNRSPVRDAIIAILREVAERDAAAEGTAVREGEWE